MIPKPSESNIQNLLALLNPLWYSNRPIVSEQLMGERWERIRVPLALSRVTPWHQLITLQFTVGAVCVCLQVVKLHLNKP